MAAERRVCDRAPRVRYWALRSPGGACFVCARFGTDEEYVALCVFDSRAAAEEYLGYLSEAQLFLDTLEQYGLSTPPWVHQEALLPETCSISRRELWEAIVDVGVGYVAVNPPPERLEEETFELQPSWMFEAG